MNIGFIGNGPMATAIIKGLLDSKFVAQPSDILAYDIVPSVLDNLVKHIGVFPCTSNQNLVDLSDFIVLAVKPNQLREAVAALDFRGKVVISVAGGISIEQIEGMIRSKHPVHIARAMTNINVSIGAGVTGICSNEHMKSDELKTVLSMFSSLGEAIEIPEASFSTFTAIAGSSPAFTYLYIDSLARAALKAGMTKEQANKIAAHAVLGSAKALLETKDAPWALIDKVCSPGGSTIAGICELEDNKFVSTIIKGVDAVIAADKDINF